MQFKIIFLVVAPYNIVSRLYLFLCASSIFQPLIKTTHSFAKHRLLHQLQHFFINKTRSMISPSPIFISFTLLFITFACATSSLNEIENFKPKGSDGFTVPSHVEEQGEESVKEYLDSVFKNALFGTDSTETLLNKEAYPHSYAIEAESNTQIKDQGK